MKSRKLCSHFPVYLFLFVLISACGTSNLVSDNNEANPAATVYIPATTTLFPTSTPTNLPMSPFPTNAFSSTPTTMATITPFDVSEQIVELLVSNTGCRLPCWWGFTPGETSWQTAESFLETVASQITIVGSEIRYNAHVYIPVPKEVFPVPLVHTYTVQDNIIEMIQLYTGNVPTYQLISIIESYGEPTEIWIKTYNRAREGDLPFHILLFYPDQGILAAYSVQATKEDNVIIGCSKNALSANLILWSPKRATTFEEIIAQTIQFRELTPYPLDEVANLDIESFYQLILGGDDLGCIKTSDSFWPSPGGG